ncbi:MAG: aminotransferase class IV [Spirosomaceae bacterium]|jgi:4-amino-4-deoxychorismate lyase|nr:aminotransferase class IV [Spirosomataceae bacterium]
MFIETFRITNGNLPDCKHHNARLHRTRQAHFDDIVAWDLAQLVSVPAHAREGVWKGRLSYTKNVEKIEFEPYRPRLIQSLRLVQCDAVDYNFKFQNRQIINDLYAQRGSDDDVLIVKNGCVTDASYANVVFWDGTRWLTPDTPLLEGTQRARLLEDRQIQTTRIQPSDLAKFSYARLINAMLVFEDTPLIPIANIF